MRIKKIYYDMSEILFQYPMPKDFKIGEKGRKKKWCRLVVGRGKGIRSKIRKKVYSEWVKKQQEKRRTNAV
jgi:hypothetical protein